MRKSSGFLISEDQIRQRITELASQIEKDFMGEVPILVGILKGSFVFLADLMRKLNMDVQVDFLGVSSYGKSTKTSGIVKILKDLGTSIEGRDVILVEDICDSGLTLKYIVDLLRSRKPRTIKVCVLLDKKERKVVNINLDYVGFEVPDRFLVGYGLDYGERYRNLPYIRELFPEELSEAESDEK
ncbi:MAG TPA: hypoxanthine phosphoribosyltransferase [Candidatus Hydrothermia bacterium]|nr:hypoxanthine phosphoribosyltransferase [Candidatus Hydrothermae bacterium]MDD3648514.1 hypoxanthine phosphoribosyltransferase [Candidatus Hydrothermia bacterium]MDD5572486.1 hypoxanthine phosphoribosyltransferase [Candidatus Hydrothermia bacterium]HOK23723.1 hypoxanthine phosphoribosyltransferase [Candidatus Hydrothermia bacterium]HOL24432.1 hypoxanthine phosphoribosyltransferase [Candidatus Hydrothermia bacterium]